MQLSCPQTVIMSSVSKSAHLWVPADLLSPTLLPRNQSWLEGATVKGVFPTFSV